MLYRFGVFELDTTRHELRADGTLRVIEPQVFDLLRHLIENHDRIVSRDELIAAIWNGRIVSESTIDARVHAVRKAVDDDGRRQSRIKTVQRCGYRFVADVETVDDRDLTMASDPIAVGKYPPSIDDKPKLALLPFANMSEDPEQAFFARGITEEIIAQLTRFHHLFVLVADSTFRSKDASADARSVGKELGVRYVVEGSVRRAKDRVRIAVQLIDAETASHVWAETFERQLNAKNIFEIQDEITSNIVGSIGSGHGAIARAEIEKLRGRRTENLDAYECLLCAREYHIRHTEEQHLIARICLEKAVAIDPNFAEAIAELAYVYAEEYRHDWNVLPNSLDRSLVTALRALELDPHNQTGHWALALTYFSQGKLDAFYAEACRAVEINPNNSTITGFIAHFMTPTGRWEEGTALMKRAMTINPGGPSWYNLTFFFNLFRKGEYNAALEKLHRAGLKNYYMVQLHYAAVYGKLGRNSEAREAVARLREICPDFTIRNAILEYQTKRNFEPNILENLIDGLRKAGLPE